MAKTLGVYSATQFMTVLQAVLYASDELGGELIDITTSHVEDDTLIVTIPNGQQFALVAHQMVPAAAVAA